MLDLNGKVVKTLRKCGSECEVSRGENSMSRNKDKQHLWPPGELHFWGNCSMIEVKQIGGATPDEGTKFSSYSYSSISLEPYSC